MLEIAVVARAAHLRRDPRHSSEHPVNMAFQISNVYYTKFDSITYTGAFKNLAFDLGNTRIKM